MKFFKKIGETLFGSSKAKKTTKTKGKISRRKTAKSIKKKVIKSVKKKPAKKILARTKNKPIKKKVSAKKRQPKLVKAALAAMPIAKVTHYFPHVNAAVLKIRNGEIRVGDELSFKGHTTDFKQKVASMQIDHQPVMIARKGDDFGVEVKSRVRTGDLVFKK